ncbi:MAG: enoyl-CoA hydratase-related protein [Myxococcota bacterium]
MSFTDLELEKRERCALITLDRPAARNAYSEAMVDSLIAALDDVERDPDLRCVILTGAGSAFSAGGDLKRMRDREGMFEGDPIPLKLAYERHIQRVPRRLARFDKPVVAAINGPAIGAGLDLACMADIRLASRTARFGSTFVKVGLVPGDGGAYLLPRVIGLSRALEMMLSGHIIDSIEAERIGLVSRVFSPDQLIDEAFRVATAIAQNAPLAVQLTKRAAYRSFEAGLEAALELASTYQGMVQHTADHTEAVDALLEKRSPRFEGQ